MAERIWEGKCPTIYSSGQADRAIRVTAAVYDSAPSKAQVHFAAGCADLFFYANGDDLRSLAEMLLRAAAAVGGEA